MRGDVRHLAANEIEREEQGSEALPRPGVPVPILARAGPLSPAQVLALQRAAGNGAVAKLMLAREPAAPAAAPAAPAAPPAGAPAQTPTGPTPEDPSSGVDWEAVFETNAPSLIRHALEVTRGFPVAGLFTGGLSDAINMGQDLMSVRAVAPPELMAFMAGRHAVAVLNSVLGHGVYCVELVQDVATATVVGAEFDAVTVPLNAILLAGKGAVDGMLTGLDVVLMATARYAEGKAASVGDSAAQDAWQAMIDNYDANILGDFVGAALDAYDFATLGFGNAQVIKNAASTFEHLWALTGFVRSMVWTVLQNWWNIWGGNLVGGGKGIAGQAAGAVIALELQRMRTGHALGDLAVAEASELYGELTSELELRARTMLDGRDPFAAAREAAVGGLEAMEAQISDLTEMRALTSSGAEKVAAVDEACATALALLDELALPDLGLPEMVAATIGGQIETVKATLREPLETVRENAIAIGEFLQLLSEEAAATLVEAQERTARFRAELAGCEDFEDVVDTLLDQIFDVLGMGEGFEVDDIRESWAEIGVMIDDALVWAEALRDGREAPSEGDE